jgi:hypothetical protein
MTQASRDPIPDTRDSPSRSGGLSLHDLAILAVLLAVAGWLRLANLGALGLQVDEGVQGLAVEGWLRTGLPVLPSGAVYQRSIPFMGLQVAAAGWFGLDEFALRLPAALFGVATVVVAFALGRGLFGSRVGWIAAAFIALSAWEIELSRYGRFYTAFQASYVLAFLCFYRAISPGVHRWRWAWGYVASALAAISFHEGAIVLATCFLIPLFDRTVTTKGRLMSLGGAAGFVIFAIGYRRLVGTWLAAMAPPSGLEPVAAPQAASSGSWLVSRLPSLALPDLGTLRDVAGSAAPGFLLIAIIAAVTGFLVARRNGWSGWLRTTVLVLVIASAVMHQFMIALLLLLAWLAWFASDLRQIGRVDLWTVHGSVVVSLAYWALIVRDRLGPDWKAIVLSLFGFPNVLQHFVYWFALGWPVFLLVVVGGAMMMLHRHLRLSDRAALYVVAGLVLPVALASAASSYEESRYVFHLYPILVVLFAWALLRFADATTPFVRSAQARRGLFVTVLASGFVVSGDIGALTLAPALRDYDSQRDPMRSIISWKAYAGFHQDHAGAGRFVQERAAPAELIAAIGAPHQLISYRFYTGRLDIVLGRPEDAGYQRRRGGRIVDRITGAEVVFDPAELRRRLETTGGWLLGDDVILRDDVSYLAPDVRAALRDLAGEASYRGRDDVTFVAKVN